jgi:hypothetical protein
VASVAQYQGLLKVLQADGVPRPHRSSLVSSTCCPAACILEWESAKCASDAQHAVRVWVKQAKPLHKVRSVRTPYLAIVGNRGIGMSMSSDSLIVNGSITLADGK